jgi:hypothetical protein
LLKPLSLDDPSTLSEISANGRISPNSEIIPLGELSYCFITFFLFDILSVNFESLMVGVGFHFVFKFSDLFNLLPVI